MKSVRLFLSFSFTTLIIINKKCNSASQNPSESQKVDQSECDSEEERYVDEVFLGLVCLVLSFLV